MPSDPRVRDPDDDRDLVRRHLAGDPEAFATLVERHRARLYHVCYRIVGDADEAADAVQDAFTSALRKLSTFRGDARFSTWLHRIGVNACYDILRARARRPILLLGEDAPEEGAGVPDHADLVAGTGDAAAALARIPEEFRVALVLADVEDMAYDAIAQVLDVPVGTVKSRVFRGRIALAKAMGVTREPSATAPTSQEQP